MSAGSASSDPVDLSIVIPVYNEEGNLVELWDELDGVLEAMKRPTIEPPRREPASDIDATEVVRDSKLEAHQLRPLNYEVIFVDDGSKDASLADLERARREAPADPRCVLPP